MNSGFFIFRGLKIAVINEKGSTIADIFLDRQPELWNKERTTLTLWLDPGRIKRDLLPNQHFGNPLQKGKQYSLLVDTTLKDAIGLSLKQSYSKRFVVGDRDSEVPQPQQWIITTPTAGTIEPFRIHFKEPLDYFLLLETIQVVNEKGKVVEGKISITAKEKVFEFIPNQQWQADIYKLKIASHLEDLAGNNLNRPFNRDIKLQQKTENNFVEREFVILIQ